MCSIVIDDVAILKCPICLDIFQKPKLFCCGHTFCAECITRLHISSRETNTPLACPECRRLVEIPDEGIENLPPNFVIHRLLEHRRRSNSVKDAQAQADYDIDGLTRLVFQLKQKEKSLQESKNKFLDAVRHEEGAMQQKGKQVVQRVDEEVTRLLEKVRASRVEQLSKINAHQEQIQTDISAAVRLCRTYSYARRLSAQRDNGDERTEELSNLHAETEKRLQSSAANDDLRVPSVVFTPITDLSQKTLVGQLDEVDDAESTGKSYRFI